MVIRGESKGGGLRWRFGVVVKGGWRHALALSMDTPTVMADLVNPLATPSQLACTPSMADGLPWEVEEELRIFGCQLIQSAGVLLKL